MAGGGVNAAVSDASPPVVWLDPWRGAQAIDVQSLARALLSVGPDVPAIAEVEAMLTPVERGELAAAMDAAVDRRGIVADQSNPSGGDAATASVDAVVTPITTTDQRVVVRRAEVMLDPLNGFRMSEPGIENGAITNDFGQSVANDGAGMDPSDPSETARAIEVLPPLPPGAELPLPVAGRSDQAG